MAITLDDIKKLSPQMKALLVGGYFSADRLFLLVLFPFILAGNTGNLKTKYEELSQKVDEKQRIADQKKQYMKEVVLLKQKFELAMAKLPEKKDMPFLLYDITLAGKKAGVESVLFEPVVTEAPDAKSGENKQGAGKGNEQKPAEDKKPGGKARNLRNSMKKSP